MPSSPAAPAAYAPAHPGDHPAYKPVIYLLVGIVLLGAALRATYFNPDIDRTPDERTYTRQAHMVLDHGVTGFGILGQELAQNPAAVSCYGSHSDDVAAGADGSKKGCLRLETQTTASTKILGPTIFSL
jgi:hypothetical protein